MVWFGSRFSLIFALLFTFQVGGADHVFAAKTEVKTVPAASVAESCARILTISSLDDLLVAHTKGFVPDLSKSSQKDAFHIYRKMRFGDPKTNLNEDTTAKVAQALKEHPELTKEPFRNYELSVQEKTYPVTRELQGITESLAKSAGQTAGSLFQIEANFGYWKKILAFTDTPLEEVPKLSRDQFNVMSVEQKKELKEKSRMLSERNKVTSSENQKRFLERLDSVISKEHRDFLSDTKIDMKTRAEKLFALLSAERGKMLKQGEDVRLISQALVDVVHIVGFSDHAIAEGLKSKDGYERINALRNMMRVRDDFTMNNVGFKGHFEGLLKELDVRLPSGVESQEMLGETLSKIEGAVVAGAQVVKNKNSSRTIRHLSIVESPWRSCLGGSDCSSRTYLMRALDPNYHYFTLTDAQGYSSGHVTIVTGEANTTMREPPKENVSLWKKIFGKTGPQTVKVAFIDKIQNVQDRDLPAMIEGIRKSVAEKGYVLALPEDLGDINGVSNDYSTREFVRRHIGTEDMVLTGFKPHKHEYKFQNAYSRADNGLVMRPVAEYALKKGGSTGIEEIIPGEIDEPWKIKKLDLKELVKASVELKNGTEEDKLRYIPAMEVVKAAELEVDPEFEKVLSLWVADKSQSFALRRQVLMYEWTQNRKSLSVLLDRFEQTEQINLIQNLLDTPRYKDIVLKRKADLPGLMVKARASKKVRHILAEKFEPKYLSIIDRILDTDGINAEKASAAIESVAQSLNSVRIADVVKFEAALTGTPLEGWAKDQTINSLIDRVFTESQLVQEVMQNISSKNPATQDFINRLFDQLDSNPKLVSFEQLASLHEIVKKFAGDVESWILAEATAQEPKACVLEGMYALEGKRFKQIYKRLSEADQKYISEWIERRSARALFEGMSIDQKLPKEFFAKADANSFQFIEINFPKEGKVFQLGSPENETHRYDNEVQRNVTLTKSFEMMATTVTQLQWFLVMGENPSRFKNAEHADGDHIKVGQVSVNAAHPVEQVSWDDVQLFIKKLNALSTEYEYRLPTEAEWEAAARAGTQTAYSFGNDAQALNENGWSYENANSRTHAVGLKQPNPAGLYDMHGNVWEWVQDWYSASPGSGQDPQGPDTGSYRVLRGGSWYNYAQYLRSALRYYYAPG